MLFTIIFARERLVTRIAQVKNPSACTFRASRDGDTETSGQTIQSLAT